jgi:hypothetical protein
MSDSGAFTLRMKRTSYKSQDLYYEEPGFTLKVYLEMSGVPDYDFVGVINAFDNWTEPAGAPISEGKRDQILQRIQAWSISERVRLDFSPPMNFDVALQDMGRKGWMIDRQSDRTVRATAPNRSDLGAATTAIEPVGLFQKLWKAFGGANIANLTRFFWARVVLGIACAIAAIWTFWRFAKS